MECRNRNEFNGFYPRQQLYTWQISDLYKNIRSRSEQRDSDCIRFFSWSIWLSSWTHFPVSSTGTFQVTRHFLHSHLQTGLVFHPVCTADADRPLSLRSTAYSHFVYTGPIDLPESGSCSSFRFSNFLHHNPDLCILISSPLPYLDLLMHFETQPHIPSLHISLQIQSFPHLLPEIYFFSTRYPGL